MNVTTGRLIARRVWPAVTLTERRTGLLGRSFVPEDTGLWIAPCSSVHTFGMQFPIDLIWLDPEFRVLAVIARLMPGSKVDCQGAASVVELAAGQIARTDTLPGHRLALRN